MLVRIPFGPELVATTEGNWLSSVCALVPGEALSIRRLSSVLSL